MKCRYDADFIKNYTDGAISLESRAQFEEHLKDCESCSRAAAGDRALLEFLTEQPDLSGSTGTAVAHIMMQIDPNRYKRHKAAYKIRGVLTGLIPAPGVMAAFAAAIVLLAAVYLNPWVFDSLLGNRNGTADGRQETEKTIDGREVPVNWIDKGWAAVKDEALVKELNEEGMGVAPWEVIYADRDKVLFRSYASMVAYRDGHIYRAADLDSLYFDHIQGDVTTELKIGAKGRYVVMGNYNHAADLDPDFKNDVCLFDTEAGRYFVLGRANYASVADAWSPYGKYYVYAGKKDNRLLLFDAGNIRLYEITLDVPDIEKVYVTDSGKISVQTSQGMVAFLDGGETKSETIVAAGSILHYADAERKSAYVSENGTLWEVEAGRGKDTKKAIFEGLEPQWNINLVNDRYLAARIALDQVGVYDVRTRERKTFKAGNVDGGYPSGLRINPGASMIFYGDIKPYASYDKQENTIPMPDMMAYYSQWMDEYRLVYVDSPMDDMQAGAGHFTITTLDIRTFQKEILFSTKAEEKPAQGYIGGGTRVYQEPDERSQELGNTYYVDSIFLDRIEKIVDGWAKVTVSDPPMDGWVKASEIYSSPSEIPRHPDEELIRDTVAEYIHAMYEGDTQKLSQLTVNQAARELKKGDYGIFKGQKLEKIVSIRVSAVDANTAFVVARVEAEGTGYNDEITLTGAKGIWRISESARQP